MTGNYRMTVTWAMDGRQDRKWLLHAENLDRRPGLRNVGWRATDELGDLRDRTRELIGGQHPELVTLEVLLVVPPEIQASLDRAAELDATGGDPAAVERQLARARQKLAEFGLDEFEIDQVMPAARAAGSR
jgi:hypothetical protein